MHNEMKEILDKLRSTANSKMDFTYTIIQKLEAKSLYNYITNLEKCYCNRTDCSARIKDSKKYDSLLQENEKLQEENKRLRKFLNDNNSNNDTIYILCIKNK